MTAAPYHPPAFPPVSDALRYVARINWPALADRSLAALLLVAAIAHALTENCTYRNC